VGHSYKKLLKISNTIRMGFGWNLLKIKKIIIDPQYKINEAKTLHKTAI
jgi:hypothetical protein